MRGDRIVAQHRMALLQEIANAEQRQRTKDHDRQQQNSDEMPVDQDDPEQKSRGHAADGQNDEARREGQQQRLPQPFLRQRKALCRILRLVVLGHDPSPRQSEAHDMPSPVIRL